MCCVLRNVQAEKKPRKPLSTARHKTGTSTQQPRTKNPIDLPGLFGKIKSTPHPPLSPALLEIGLVLTWSGFRRIRPLGYAARHAYGGFRLHRSRGWIQWECMHVMLVTYLPVVVCFNGFPGGAVGVKFRKNSQTYSNASSLVQTTAGPRITSGSEVTIFFILAMQVTFFITPSFGEHWGL